MTVYKLTRQDNTTGGGGYPLLTWGEGVTHAFPEEERGTVLCAPGILHAYRNPLTAVFCNPIHANFDEPELWEAETPGVVAENDMKLGCHRLTTVRRLPVPVISTAARVRVAVLLAYNDCAPEQWRWWADIWLGGEDRTEAAARAAAWVTVRAAWTQPQMQFAERLERVIAECVDAEAKWTEGME